MLKPHSIWILGWLFLLPIGSLPAQDADWTPVATDLLLREETGFGGLCGIVVDHQTGAVFVNLSDRGMFRSDDQGKHWKRVSDTQPSGRTETPGCWLRDPTGKTNRMVTALVYGDPLSVSNDEAATWKSMESKSNHIDWCAVDWTGTALRFVLALKHEADGLLLASADGGQSFVEVGKGYGPGWIFDNQTAVVAQARSQERPHPRLMHTTDRGRTFHSCGAYTPVGFNSAQALPKWHAGRLYWLVESGLIVTKDEGETWDKIADIKDAQYGPIFGLDARHLFVLTKSGVIESTDAGVNWSSPVPPPKAMNGLAGLTWLEYDPQHDTLYLMKMGSDLYRWSRGK